MAEEKAGQPTFRARVKFDYDAEEDSEVSIKAHEEILVLQVNENGWWFSRTQEGLTGWVPSNFLEKIEERPIVKDLGVKPDPGSVQVSKKFDPLPHLKFPGVGEEGCGNCGREFDSGFVMGAGKKFHEECFVCCVCLKSVLDSGYVEKEGKMYCEEDFHLEFAPKCAACTKPLSGQFLTALDKGWHVECFVCTACKSPFPGGIYRKHEGLPYCEEDFSNLFAKKCDHCRKPIVSQFIEAGDKCFHPECFLCSEGHPIPEDAEYFEKDGKLMCGEHYRALVLPKCFKCGLVLEGEYVNVNGKGFHMKCFTCTQCDCSLTDGRFDFFDEKVYCHSHIKALKAAASAPEKISKPLPSTDEKKLPDPKPVVPEAKALPENPKAAETRKVPENPSVIVSVTKSEPDADEVPIARQVIPSSSAESSKQRTPPGKPSAPKAEDPASHLKAAAPVAGTAESSISAPVETKDLTKTRTKPDVPRSTPMASFSSVSSAPKPASSTKTIIDYSGPFHPYSALKNKTLEELPSGVDASRKEMYLTAEEFFDVLGMSKEDFERQKDWKKKKLKTDGGIW